MNIKQAKQQIKNAMTAYFTRDEEGQYCIPVSKQRPVILIGPPGIGKTAVMEQIAQELDVGLVSYSMTHHTRQSALGLPFIVKENFDGREVEVSEYTMSEIIASVYRHMRDTGHKEGILFLDEINCVSETLAPCMLQFLQYKVFGQHALPEGWLVAAAGNPPEYNRSVRDFDIVTWDRLKRIDVEPDYDTWREYAGEKCMHPAVLSYLGIRKKDFYTVETTVEGRCYATPRGWEDLSEMIRMSEYHQLPVDELLISQYIRYPRISRDFAVYYELYRKYKSDYQVERIMEGSEDKEIGERAKKAEFDERYTLLSLLFEQIKTDMKDVCDEKAKLLLRREEIKAMKETGDPAAEEAAEAYRDKVSMHRIRAEHAGRRADHALDFCTRAFGEGEETLLLVTEMTADPHTAAFIASYGCDGYYRHNQALQFSQRQKDIVRMIENLDIEED